MFRKKIKNDLNIIIERWVDPSGNAWRLGIEVKTLGDRPEPVALLITPVESGYALSQSTIRAIPFAGFVRNDKSPPYKYISVGAIIRQKAAMEAMEAMSQTPPRRENRRYTDYELERVAMIYRDAYECHIPVQRAVADGLEIPLSTAIKQIIAARKRGLIPPRTRTKE